MEIQQIETGALEIIGQKWPAIGITELRSGSHEPNQVFARWVFIELLYREAGLSRRLVAEAVNYRTPASVGAALKALDDNVATNRRKAQELADSVSLFRRLLQEGNRACSR